MDNNPWNTLFGQILIVSAMLSATVGFLAAANAVGLFSSDSKTEDVVTEESAIVEPFSADADTINLTVSDAYASSEPSTEIDPIQNNDRAMTEETEQFASPDPEGPFELQSGTDERTSEELEQSL